jgi:micrococcal nuclease
MNLFCWLLTCTLSGPAAVHDGDTIRVAGHSIRLHGLDAEELNEPHGDAARRVLVEIIGGRDVTCTHRGEKSYHRIMATCEVDGVDLGAEMVKRGAALDCARYSHGRYRAFEPAGIRAVLSQKGYCL